MELTVKTNYREELIGITDLIEEKLSIENGLLHVFVPHASCGITINENADPNLPKDIIYFLNKVVPKGKWKHDEIDGNADAHIKASLMGSSVMIPVKNGELQLGRWQDIFLCEFDGPRERKIILTFIENK
jgi:secondary thiamine-phosphate synthase enzyme